MKSAHWLRFAMFIFLSLALAACDGSYNGRESTTQQRQPAEAPVDSNAGAAERGAQLFTRSIGSLPSCSTCHALDDSRIVGPGMAGVATRAAERVANQTAEEYLRTSIVDPGAYVVEGYMDVMPPAYGQVLSDGQIDDLVAYLHTME